MVMIKQNYLHQLSLINLLLTDNVKCNNVIKETTATDSRSFPSVSVPSVCASAGLPEPIRMISLTDKSPPILHVKSAIKLLTSPEQFQRCCSHHTDQSHQLSLTALTSPDLRPSASTFTERSLLLCYSAFCICCSSMAHRYM